MAFYDKFPYTNFHELNTDWIIQKIKHIDDSVEESAASAEASAASASASEESAQASAASAEASADSASASDQSAQDAATSASGIEAAREQIYLNTARLDNLIVDGTPTEGNTELLDIRVGANGVTYPTAGDAVRGQYDELNQALSMTALSWTTGHAIKTNTSTVDLTPVENASWDYMLINCVAGDTFMINAVGGGDYRLWCFIDEYNNRLSVADANADAEHSDLVIIAPARAVKCIINSFSWKHADTSYKLGVASVANNASSDILKNETSIQNDESLAEIKQISFTSGANIKLGTTIGATVNLTPDTSATNWSYAIVNCEEGDVFIISGYGTGNSMPYGFIDKDNKLLSLSPSSTLTNQVVTAPENTAKIVINSTTSSIPRGENKYILKVKNRLENEIDVLEDRIDFTDNMCLVDDIPYETGYNYTVYNSPYYTVSVSKHPDANWKSCVLECAEGAKFIVSGYGTENTPVYAFIDAANRLLARSQTSTLNGVEIVAPTGTARLILNTVASALDNKVVPKYNKYSAYVKSYDYIKGENVLSNPPADNVIYAYCNGIKFSEEIMSPVIDFNKTGDLFMHVPTFKIIDGVVYATYYVNTRSVNEQPSEMTARFAYASMSDPTNITYIDLQDVGETFDGKTVTAIYDTILMTIDSDVLYLMWTAKLGDEYCRLYKTYTISTGTMSSAQYNTFTVNGNTENFTVGNMETLFEDAGIAYKPMTLDIGIMQKITSHVDSGTTYYYTGCYNQQFNCIIKSSDLINWIYVTQPTFECLANYENAVYVSGDYCYYFLRLLTQYSYGLLARYDIINDVWGYPVQVSDCQSRSDFFEANGTLYLVHAPQDRNHISIMQINKDNLNKSFEVQTGAIDYGFYPYVDSYNSELYIAFCWKYKHIYVSRFTLLPYLRSTIAQKIIALLEN